jgi:hypothetical protein
MTKWMSIKDHAPEKEGYYLVFAPNYKKPHIYKFGPHVIGSRMRFWNNSGTEALTVTHWMELPGAPNE